MLTLCIPFQLSAGAKSVLPFPTLSIGPTLFEQPSVRCDAMEDRAQSSDW